MSREGDGLAEIGERTWRLESTIDGRNVFQYLLGSSDLDQLLLIDTGTAKTPRDVVMPALRRLGLDPERLRTVVVTHPDVDHQGGLAALRLLCSGASLVCGFADKPMVADPEKLLNDRYLTYEHEHGLGYTTDERAWIRDNYGEPVEIDATCAGGELLDLGERRLEALHVPGHAAGHLALYEREAKRLFSSDAVHGAGCPAADGTPALCPTYEEVDAYLASIDLVEEIAPGELHSGHWPVREGAAVGAFLNESREFVAAVDRILIDAVANGPASMAELCERVQTDGGPWTSEPRMLMFAVSGHLRRLIRRGLVEAASPTSVPRTYRVPEDSGGRDAVGSNLGVVPG